MLMKTKELLKMMKHMPPLRADEGNENDWFFRRLVLSMWTNGYLEDRPIITYKGRVIGGRQRILAADYLDIEEIPVRELTETEAMEMARPMLVSNGPCVRYYRE